MVSASLVATKAANQHKQATEFAVENTAYQCGHLVFLRATQIAGIPIDAAHLNSLPFRRNGISLGELRTAFEKIGFDSRIQYSRNPGTLPALSICKLNDPDHFVLVQPIDNGQLKVHSELDRPLVVSIESFSKNFSGYFLELIPTKNPVQIVGATAGPLPQFESLYQDAGKLDYKDYEKSPVKYKFRFKNIGSEPLIVSRVVTSCDCTRNQFPDSPVLPGQTASIEVDYKSQLGNSDGDFSQTLFVETNCKSLPFIRLEISGAFPGRISSYPKNIEVRAVREVVAAHYVFVDVPPWIDPTRIDARITDVNGLAVETVTVSLASLAAYNKTFSDRDSSFIPIIDRPGLVIFRLDFQFGIDSSVSQTLSFEAFDKDHELGSVSSTLNIRDF